MEDFLDYLNPRILATLEDYQIISQTAVNGFLNGLHRSIYHGLGTEFVQYRNYSQGDDLKYIDWKVLGKSDRIYTKVYEEEGDMDGHIILDLSASMDYGKEVFDNMKSKEISKLHYSKLCSASLAYLIYQQSDNVGFSAYNDKLHTHIKASNSKSAIDNILISLSQAKASNSADHKKHLSFLAESLTKRGIVIFISDMLSNEEEIFQNLEQIRFNHHECLLIQILHKDELYFPFEGSKRFIDSENNIEISTSPDSIKSEYLSKLTKHNQHIRDSCISAGINHLLLDTSQSLELVLASYLQQREGMRT